MEIPASIARWLISDGVVLPDVEHAFPTRQSRDPYDDSDDDWSTESSSPSETCGAPPPEELSDMYATVKDAIEDLGGRVVPKLQWSCPKDASWMMPNNTMQCATPDEVFLLLKSSDRIAHDVEVLQRIRDSATSPRSPLAQENQERSIPDNVHVLALRKWYDLKPGREFRCFVKNNKLIAISQRDVLCKHQHIVDHVDHIKQRIQHFYDAVVHTRFTLETFSFDCYVPEADHAAVRVIDFNPFCHQQEEEQEDEGAATTNPLLFSWEELHGLCNQSNAVEFRYIDKDVPVQPESALYGVPFDFVDTRQGSALTNLLEHANASWKEFKNHT